MLPVQAVQIIQTTAADSTKMLLFIGLTIAGLVIAALVYMYHRLTHKACSSTGNASSSDATMHGTGTINAIMVHTDRPGKAHTVAMSTHPSAGIYRTIPFEGENDRNSNICV